MPAFTSTKRAPGRPRCWSSPAILNQALPWSYYGMWQMEQGNRLKAEDFLQKVNVLCGTTACEEYRQLKAVIDGTGSY